MQEPPHGANHGRRASDNPEVEGRHLELDTASGQALEFMQAGGWSVVHAKHGAEAGLVAHRGVLHPEEYVSGQALAGMVTHHLGFTYEQIRSVYRQGPLGPDQRRLRTEIDSALLALSRSGANMVALGAALGFPVKGGNCRTIDNALYRAREEA